MGVAHRIEQARALDGPAELLGSMVSKAFGSGRVRRGLSGSWLGHPAHPALIAGPLGCWTAASLLDLTGERDAARRLIGAGLLAAVPTVATGLSDWAGTAGAGRRVGLVHMTVNAAAATAYAFSWQARRRDSHGVGVVAALGGAAIAGFGGWLGGHLSYALGVGVDSKAFEAGGQNVRALRSNRVKP